MRVVLQVVKEASVTISGKEYSSINDGFLLLVSFTNNDNLEVIKKVINKIVSLRIFPDENGVMNKSILDYGGSILSISQFTLYADTKKGNRPSYINALSGEYSSKLYDEFNKVLSESIHVETGIFGADMEVDITNIGPTTIMLER